LESYETFAREEAIPKNRAQSVQRDQNGRFIAKRSKPVFARVRFLTFTEGEEYYFQQLLLRLPFRNTEFVSEGNFSRTFKEECYLRCIIEEGDEVEEGLELAVKKGYVLSGEKGKEECIPRAQKTREQVRARGHLNTHTTLSPLHRGRQPALDDKESWYFWKTSLASFRSSS